MNFDRTLRDGWRQDGDTWEHELPEGWGQGRAVFGGLAAALAAGLTLRHAGGERPLRTLTLALLRPLVAGPVRGVCRTLRRGKNVTFVEVRLSQSGEEALVATATLTQARPSTVDVSADRWQGPDPQTLTDLPHLPGLMPECMKHVQTRWAAGGAPYSGANEARLSGYCRFREPSGDVEGLLGLLDAWPPPSLSLLRKPAASSTVSWTAHLLRVPERFDGFFAFAYETIAGADGFHTVAGRLYGSDGGLVAFSEQLVAIFG